ncbi:hypothetical protein JNK13_07750 [bacterium]|nr:hypothetical protein [bacterium]
MRDAVTKEKLQAFIEAIGKSSSGPGRVYFVGGSTALLLGIRNQTIDIDIKLDPEPPGVFQRIATLKDELLINVELAAPDDFVPALPGWQERSEFIARSGQVEFYHYDFYGQALAKIERGHQHDLSDVREFVKKGKVNPQKLSEYFEQIKPNLIRYPALNPVDLEARLKKIVLELSA